MFFTGTYELTIDAKNRLSIPFAVRRKLGGEGDGQAFYVMPGRRPGTLALYAEKYYERLRADLPSDDSLSDEAYAYRQFEYSQSALLDPDAQGRVLIPERLLKHAGLEKDVVLIAVRDHLELWRQAEFAAFDASMWPAYPEKRAQALAEMKNLAPGLSPVALRPASEPAEQR
jgi:MraZ protein